MFYSSVSCAPALPLSGGYNVYPGEIEAVLCDMRSIAACAVVGVADERWGEIPVAAIVARGDSRLTAADIMQLCDMRLAKYKRPRHVVFVEDLPRNSVGKVQKHILREQLAAIIEHKSDVVRGTNDLDAADGVKKLSL